MIKKFFKKENGAITLFVLLAMLFFLIVIFSVFISTSNKKQSQISEIDEIKKEYEQSVNNIDAIYNNALTVSNVLKVGDVVRYDTGNPNVGDNGVIDCIVLYDTAYNRENGTNYGTQIISEDIIGNPITIGVSNDFISCTNSYNNALKILYDEAQKYLNTDYATTARCVGSKPDDPDWDMTENEAGFYTKEVAESKREYQSYLETNGWYNIFKNGDTNYTIDWTQMGTITNRNIKVASDDYWVASRNVIIGSTQSGFLVRDVNTSGEFSSRYGGLLTLSSQGTRLILSLSLGFRPVFTLKSDINISGGNGNALTPYTLAP